MPCPEATIELPDREIPWEAMQECPEYPSMPEALADMNAEDTAKLLVGAYVAGSESYRVCESYRQALIDWINE